MLHSCKERGLNGVGTAGVGTAEWRVGDGGWHHGLEPIDPIEEAMGPWTTRGEGSDRHGHSSLLTTSRNKIGKWGGVHWETTSIQFLA